MDTDTIAAIATAMSPSGIGIIRISGSDAFAVIDRIYRSTSGKKKLSLCESHTVHHGFIYDGNELLDEIMVVLMRGPKSYTREDCVEIDCHGGVYVMRQILDVVIRNGARPAEPGEFTRRAFLNGRIDLTQAESVIDLINSKNQFALTSSIKQLKGDLKNKIISVRSKIIHEIAFIESALDDPEHISLEDYPDKLSSLVSLMITDIEELLRHSEDGRIKKEGIQTVIVGKPNAGKSSVLNMLVGEDRAIVTNIAGTTRDVLEEEIFLDGITLNIIDTAGIHDTEDVVEKIGVDKAYDKVFNADLILYIIDSSIPLDKNDEHIMDLISDKKCIVLLNKSDIGSVIDPSAIAARLHQKVIIFSAKEHLGIDQLKAAITEMFYDGSITFNDELYITNVRQKNKLRESLDSLKLVKKSIEDGMPEDFFSIDLMNAYSALGNILGEEVDDDLINEIFSKFCMGK